MGVFIAAWICPVIAILGMIQEGESMAEMTSSLFETGLLGCLVVIVFMIVSIFSDGDSCEELLEPSGILGHLARIGCVVDAGCFFTGLYISYHTVIQNWVKENGLWLNLSYIFILLLIVFLNWKAKRADRKKQKKSDLLDEALALSEKKEKSLVAYLLFVPTLVLYLFNGMPDGGRYHMLAPIAFSEWQWANKLSLVALAFVLAKYVILEGFVKKNYADVWKNFALLSNVGVLTFLFVLVQRGLNAIGGLTQMVFFIVSTGIETLLQFYSYIFIFYCVIDFFAPGAIREALKEAEQRELANLEKKKAREAYEAKLDEKERRFNERFGPGYYTDEEIQMRKRNQIVEEYNEYAMKSFLREQKLDKFDKKYDKENKG